MSCTPECIPPSRAQAHCAVCHITWSGVQGFDAHRRAGVCRTPAELGYRANAHGVYSKPVTRDQRERLAALRDRDGYAPSAHAGTPQTAELASGVSRGYGSDDSEPANSISGGPA